MLRKVILWFITYGLSCILSNIFRGLGQGQIFFYIYAGTPIILLTFEMFSASKPPFNQAYFPLYRSFGNQNSSHSILYIIEEGFSI